jgi:hypothetical protein
MSNIAIQGAATGTGVFTLASPATNTDRTLTLPDEAGTLALTQSLSYVRLNTANGAGSINTKIRRFTNVLENQGVDITYADSATLGGSFTINTNGVYSIHFAEAPNVAGDFGVSLNSTQLTTSIYSINLADKIAATTSAVNGYLTVCSVTVYIAATGVVRAHTDGGAATGNRPSLFTIARVA